MQPCIDFRLLHFILSSYAMMCWVLDNLSLLEKQDHGEINKTNAKNKTQYNRDTDIRRSPSVGYIHQRNCEVIHLLLSSKMKGYNLQHTHCNFLLFLSQTPLLEYNIHHIPQPQYNSLIKEGFLQGKKTLT
jgi:hypothetical protein